MIAILNCWVKTVRSLIVIWRVLVFGYRHLGWCSCLADHRGRMDPTFLVRSDRLRIYTWFRKFIEVQLHNVLYKDLHLILVLQLCGVYNPFIFQVVKKIFQILYDILCTILFLL